MGIIWRPKRKSKKKVDIPGVAAEADWSSNRIYWIIRKYLPYMNITIIWRNCVHADDPLQFIIYHVSLRGRLVSKQKKYHAEREK